LLERLKTRPDFLRVARARRKSVTPGLILQVAPREPGDEPSTDPVSGAGDGACRIGFTASRKVGGAVVRNRARRRLREAVELVMPAHAKGRRDYVLIARSTTAGRPFDALVDDLETALKHVESYRDASEMDADAGGS
jgi:ribonuclease P protein component